ncbi:DNA-binding protein, partial [Phocaeicola vulgatus]
MAILFDWYENPKTSEQQGEENMLHPRLRLNGKVSTAQLRARIQKYCTLTETDVI